MTVPPCPYLHGRTAFGPSCTVFGCWRFDNGATSKFDDVLLVHGGLHHVIPLAVHLHFFGWTSRGDHPETFLPFEFGCGTLSAYLEVVDGGWWWWGSVVVGGGGLQDFSVSPSPLWF